MFINCRNQYKEQTTYLPREKMELIWYKATLNADVSKSYQTVDSDPITFHPTFDLLIHIFDVRGAVKGTNTGTFLTFCFIDWNQYLLWLSCILKAVYYTATTSVLAWWQKGTMSVSCLLGISMHNTAQYYNGKLVISQFCHLWDSLILKTTTCISLTSNDLDFLTFNHDPDLWPWPLTLSLCDVSIWCV